MKKLMGAVIALGMASTALATATFEYGALWYFPKYDAVYNTTNFNAQGQTFSANWDLDNDLIVGVYQESTQMIETDSGYDYPFSVSAITIAKGVVKNASVGLHLGTFYENFNGYSGLLTDLFGSVTLVSGSADKVGGALKASFGGRFAHDSYYYGDFGGYFVNLGVAVSL